MSEQPEGIDRQLDAEIAEQHHTEADAGADLATPATERVDPDDPEQAMQQASEAATDPSAETAHTTD